LIKKRSNCRLCLSPDVKMIYAMPHCPPVDNYRFADDPDIDLPGFPMDLYMCQSCGHAQLLDVVDPDILFGNYIYTSSSSPDLNDHFTAYANTLVQYAGLGDGDLVVDIGSNDGLLLSKFLSHGVRVVGIDPAAEVAKQAIAKGIPTVVSFINETACDSVRKDYGLANVVCANNVFSHSDDLIGFAKCVKSLLKDDGLFVFEVSYLRDLVENKVIDYVYHEHLAHHSIKALKSFFDSLDMTLIDVQRVVVKGGSIRCFASNQASRWAEKQIIGDMIAEEESRALYDPDTYSELKREMDAIGDRARAVLKTEVDAGKKVASYGASATATVINHMYDLNELFSFIVDDNAGRQGRLSPGFKTPVVSSDMLCDTMPSMTFISAWRFADMIIQRNQQYLEKGGRFIVPLPDFRIVSLDGDE